MKPREHSRVERAPRALRRRPQWVRVWLALLAAFCLSLSFGCAGSSEKKQEKKWRVEPSKKKHKTPPKSTKQKKHKHASHPHPHGPHPHPASDHHHHPHPHPHLEGPNGHHHPY